MCEYCENIPNNESKIGEPEEGIFYNEKEKKHYFIVEQARYERTRVEVKNCPMCGKLLDKEYDLYEEFLKFSYEELKDLYLKSKSKEEKSFYMALCNLKL